MLPKHMKKLIEVQQSNKALNRINKVHTEAIKGKCTLCKREGVLIYKRKHMLCKMCYSWCHNYLSALKGFYNESFLYEAIIAFQKPIKCRFFDTCGNFVKRLTDEKKIMANRSAICSRCAPIYQSGVQDGRLTPKRRLNNRIGYE